ncbi:MAG: hypothetical protein U0228_17825 [Myxococcaceae bacterium]
MLLALSAALVVTALPFESEGPVAGRSARLLDQDGVLVGVPPPPPEMVMPASAPQIQTDIAALRRMRPGIGGGIALIVAGGALMAAGGLYTALGVGVNVVVMWAMGVGCLVVGGPVLVIGVWLLVTRLPERDRIDAELNRLRLELAERQRLDRGLAPRFDGPATGVPLGSF